MRFRTHSPSLPTTHRTARIRTRLLPQHRRGHRHDTHLHSLPTFPPFPSSGKQSIRSSPESEPIPIPIPTRRADVPLPSRTLSPAVAPGHTSQTALPPSPAGLTSRQALRAVKARQASPKRAEVLPAFERRMHHRSPAHPYHAVPHQMQATCLSSTTMYAFSLPFVSSLPLGTKESPPPAPASNRTGVDSCFRIIDSRLRLSTLISSTSSHPHAAPRHHPRPRSLSPRIRLLILGKSSFFEESQGTRARTSTPRKGNGEITHDASSFSPSPLEWAGGAVDPRRLHHPPSAAPLADMPLYSLIRRGRRAPWPSPLLFRSPPVPALPPALEDPCPSRARISSGNGGRTPQPKLYEPE
ncbi:hypothetical protein B0H14DRAFT_3478057 [Mycena olivaceomarginata]|nr:hypothetical protein B0H14DRAFT_3478057 [Mycena olivaceomarginata]